MQQIKLGNGMLINGDNLEIMKRYEDNYFDNCISDFPYDLGFMGKKWDTYNNFYEWCKQRAEGLFRIIKHGGYVLIFGHHKTNHRMKCAFEDAGFKIVEEIDWCYASGFPKNQDIGKLFDKDAKVTRRGTGKFNSSKGVRSGDNNLVGDNYNCKGYEITLPETDLAKQWNGWKTSGLKPAKEIVTVFQKPLKGKYIDNIKEYGCGAMNIDACRVEYKNQADLDLVKAKCSFTENSKSIGFGTADSLYGTGNTPLEQARDCVKEEGRFPANIIFDTYMGQVLDKQSGERASGKSNNNAPKGESGRLTPLRRGTLVPRNDTGGASRFFLNIDQEDFIPFMYCSKPTKKEKGEYCSHITVKPKKLIKWLIKLVTPIDGKSLDITAGSGTHGLSCEELNKEEEYNIEWVDIELLNTEKEPYCEIAKRRIEEVIKNKSA
ncbi:UNVERIFIED_ORG: hypothetical protein B2H93_04510 [Clostridium botulinum]